jgi:hypothetical protein
MVFTPVEVAREQGGEPSSSGPITCPPDRAEGFKTFTHEAPSEEMQYAIVVWAAICGETRDAIIRQTPGLAFGEAVKLARRLIEEGALD